MHIRIDLIGRTPLLMHNPRMVDPEFALNREIKALTSKRKKTDEDFKNIERLEWYGGLYSEEIGGRVIVVQPTAKLRKCLINTAKISKMGKTVERAISFSDLFVPLIYDGPQQIDQLAVLPAYVSRLSVGIGNKRVMRVRPQFNAWSMQVTGVLIEDAGLNFAELERIVDLAGQAEGIGDNRANGYGRFVGQVVNLGV